MKDFTYESTDRKNIYETYEWDNVWIDHADDNEKKRVLYIGDSISCGTRRIATEKTGEKILFDGFGTSKGIDNPYFKDSLKLFALQEGEREAIIFNNGLHGWHLDDEEEYGKYYEDMIKFLVEEYKNTPLFVVLTTHLKDEGRAKRVIARNKTACAIAEKYGLTVIDLYNVSLKNSDLLCEDGVHFTNDGYILLAEEIINILTSSVESLAL